MRLVYDVNNRLAFALTPSNTVAFGYSADGSRLWEQSGTNALQVWIGNNYEEKNGQVLYHVYADGRLIATFDKTGTNVFQYYQPNNLTSTSIQTDTNGTPVQHYEYSAFGQSRYIEKSGATVVVKMDDQSNRFSIHSAMARARMKTTMPRTNGRQSASAWRTWMGC